MGAEEINVLISTIGFPIVAVLGLAWFIYKVYTDGQEQSKKNMEQLQEAAKEREEKLYQMNAECRAVNEKAIETIALYTTKLDTIQSDLSDIKSDIIEIKHKN